MNKPKWPTAADLLERIVESDKGCWVWQGGVTTGGYGSAHVGRKTYRAHRISWVVFRGDIPIGLWVLHTCDNPPCINPEHLYLGTRADNDQDAKDRNRLATGDRHGMRLHPESVPRGERQGSSRLTADIVRQMRILAGSMTQCALAQQFGITQVHVGRIINRQEWAHVE